MTEEQMERAIEFLLDHQAQFAADISILKESQAETRNNIDRITVKIDDLAEAQVRTQGQIDKTQEQINYLAKQQAKTSGELEHFSTSIQEFITEVRNKLGK